MKSKCVRLMPFCRKILTRIMFCVISGFSWKRRRWGVWWRLWRLWYLRRDLAGELHHTHRRRRHGGGRVSDLRGDFQRAPGFQPRVVQPTDLGHVTRPTESCPRNCPPGQPAESCEAKQVNWNVGRWVTRNLLGKIFLLCNSKPIGKH